MHQGILPRRLLQRLNIYSKISAVSTEALLPDSLSSSPPRGPATAFSVTSNPTMVMGMAGGHHQAWRRWIHPDIELRRGADIAALGSSAHKPDVLDLLLQLGIEADGDGDIGSWDRSPGAPAPPSPPRRSGGSPREPYPWKKRSCRASGIDHIPQAGLSVGGGHSSLPGIERKGRPPGHLHIDAQILRSGSGCWRMCTPPAHFRLRK